MTFPFPEFNYGPRLEEIAAAYDRAPILDPAARSSWRALAAHSDYLARRVMYGAARPHGRGPIKVTTTADAEPYPHADAMFDDLAAGRFVVSLANSEHPVWSIDDNRNFRIVHDVYGHWGARLRHGMAAGFDWPGEVAACALHFDLLRNWGQRGGLLVDAWRGAGALFTECLGQTGYAIDRGGFGPQKVALLAVGI